MDSLTYPLEELVPIVAEIAPKYCGYEHSSISYETAQMLMEGILYSIQECTQGDGHALVGNALPAKEAYALGQEMVAGKVRRLQAVYNSLIFEFQDYGCECLRDAITKGIPAFLARYDFRYAPQETLLTLDYPVFQDLSASSGIDAVLAYAECIRLEQAFLSEFDNAYVRETLCAYHADYESLIENICHIVLLNTVRHFILDMPLDSGKLCPADWERAKEMLARRPEGEADAYVAGIVGLLAGRSRSDDALLKSYLCLDVPDIVTRIQKGLP